MTETDRGTLLDELNARHDALLVELDALAVRIEDALAAAGFATPAATVPASPAACGLAPQHGDRAPTPSAKTKKPRKGRKSPPPIKVA